MKPLTIYLESLLDSDFDIDDSVILIEPLKKATGYKHDHEMPEVSLDGEWMVIDCASRGKDCVIMSVEPLQHAGYSKYRFVNCTEVEFYNTSGETMWSGFEIDAPEAEIQFDGNDKRLDLVDLKINARTIYIDADDSENMKISMKKCKFTCKGIHCQVVTQLSIADTCKFDGVKGLYLGRIGKSVVRKANELMMGDFKYGTKFAAQVESMIIPDAIIQQQWDIDVMKTLGLNDKKWPDLGKIVLVPNGIPASSAPGLVLYNIRKAILPCGRSKSPAMAEFKNGWNGSFVSRARTELNTFK